MLQTYRCMHWHCKRTQFQITSKPLLMGILNVTPDSFSDGGKFLTQDLALAHAEKMISAGVDIIDVGGESTRPRATIISEDEELSRVIPILKELSEKYPQVPLSIDTYKASVAKEAILCGATIVNDVGAGLWDEKMLGVLQSYDVGYICMHSQGRPETMQDQPTYKQVTTEVVQFLEERKQHFIQAGINENRLVFDPGIGFGKTLENNLDLLRQAEMFLALQRPILWGLSRKSFISKLLGVSLEERLAGGLGAYSFLLEKNFPQIWRVHDVAEHAQLIQMRETLSTKK